MAFLLACALAAIVTVGYDLQRMDRLGHVDKQLGSRLTSLSASVARGLPHSPETVALFGRETGYYFTTWDRDGFVRDRSDNAPPDLPAPRRDGNTLAHFRTRGEWREVVHCSGPGECVLAGLSLDAELAALRTFRWWLLAGGGLVLGLGLGAGRVITTRAIRPLEEIGATAARISTGDLSERVGIADSETEFGELASVLNTTFSSLEAAVDRERQVTADAAHNLRTPLTALIVETQAALSRRRTADEYRETVIECLDAAEHMRELTEARLALARVDGLQEPVARGPVDLARVAESVAARLRRRAIERDITIRCDLRPTIAFSVRERVNLVMTNLLTNAIDYNRRGGEIRLSTQSEDGRAVFTVSDTGVGIGPGDLPHIYDRFYRGDNVRSRSDGHSGLGLAICKSIVEAERGMISVASAERQGAAFTVRLPSQPWPVAA
jgi:two-component system, OmpR family, sensor kinase